MAEGADLNLSAFFDRKKADRYADRTAIGFHAFSRKINGVSFRPQPWQTVRT
jgi:hypothetical protein